MGAVLSWKAKEGGGGDLPVVKLMDTNTDVVGGLILDKSLLDKL